MEELIMSNFYKINSNISKCPIKITYHLELNFILKLFMVIWNLLSTMEIQNKKDKS